MGRKVGGQEGRRAGRQEDRKEGRKEGRQEGKQVWIKIEGRWWAPPAIQYNNRLSFNEGHKKAEYNNALSSAPQCIGS